ncbi:hypothetical protein Moror_17485 [Moniliophthora roreri MCA 2997]|uniref:Uncharacterized protein n=1 Tax=Moniliophthora roreri (strain MCA 2997) TaxID=1381753 RepID=V2XEN2_MONRO|nr:hypothetical protein Moror_17485 [Moniliophthora roreri MCA 2997]
MSSILFVFTSADKTLTGAQTGYYLPEAAHPYYVLAPHFKIDFASPKGANPPLDESSVKMFAKDNESVQWLNDETVKAKLASTKKLTEVNPDDYDVTVQPSIYLSTRPTQSLAQRSTERAKLLLLYAMDLLLWLQSLVQTVNRSSLAGKPLASQTLRKNKLAKSKMSPSS